MKNKLNNILNNKIDLKKNTNFALIIGLSPSKGARSPKLWNKAYKFFRKDTKMYPADINSNSLGKLCSYLRSDKYFLGTSVTVPYKEKMIKYLDSIDQSAKLIGSINTIKNINGNLKGYNTDFYGSLSTLKDMKLKKNNKNILIIGCGGAGKACVVSVLKYFKKSNLILLNRNFKKIRKFLKRVNKINKNRFIYMTNFSKVKNLKNIDLIINSTSIGFDSWFNKSGYFNLKNYSPLSKVSYKTIKMKNNIKFLKINKNFIKINNTNSKKILKRKNKIKIFDIIYNPKKTVLLKHGNIHGHKTFNGLKMNLIQAVEAFKIVNNIKNNTKILRGMKSNG